MSAQRLCEVKAEMRPALRQLVAENGGNALPVGHQWAMLECPYTNHCDKSGPCRGFTRENRMRIAAIDDEFFRKGFVKLDELYRR